jgi:hypothetical protein
MEHNLNNGISMVTLFKSGLSSESHQSWHSFSLHLVQECKIFTLETKLCKLEISQNIPSKFCQLRKENIHIPPKLNSPKRRLR